MVANEHREIKHLPFVYKKRLESKNGFENIPITVNLFQKKKQLNY